MFYYLFFLSPLYLKIDLRNNNYNIIINIMFSTANLEITQAKNGLTRKTVDMFKTNKKDISLDEIKKLVKDKFDPNNKGQYTIRGRNEYGTSTIYSSFTRQFADEDDDYYVERGYEKDTYESFSRFQIVYYY